jgi:hypothetical protein
MSFAQMLANERGYQPLVWPTNTNTATSQEFAEDQCPAAEPRLRSRPVQDGAGSQNLRNPPETLLQVSAPTVSADPQLAGSRHEAVRNAFFHSLELSDEAFNGLLQAKGEELSVGELRWLAARIGNTKAQQKQKILLDWALLAAQRIDPVLDGLIRLDRIPG